MKDFLLHFVCSLALSVSLAAALSSEADVYTDSELFAAICAQKDVIWIRADLDLREEHWPADCKAPVVLQQNMTISGPMDQPLNFTISFNFMARKVVIPPYGEVRLRHFTARNTRRGGGGEIDFIAYSPKGILWTDDLNKNQITCLHADPANLVVLPLPVGFPEFGNKSQLVSLWDNYCTPRRCWNEVLHYDQFYTDVNVGSDTQTGGYVMAKRNASKTCDQFVSSDCIQNKGGDACMQQVITDFLSQLPAIGGGGGGSGSPLVIALPVALGGAALMAAVIATALVLSRRRRRRREAVTAAAAAAARAKLYGTDLESGGAGGDDGAARGLVHGSKVVDSGSTGSKEIVSGSSSGDDGQQRSRPREEEELGGGGGGHIQDSFRFETQDDMGRCLSGHRGGCGAVSSLPSGSSSGVLALVEGIMQDGSACTIAIGTPLGQGSYGVVFKGTWRDKPVAVKLIMCDPTCSEQVATEVRLMTSEACRHPNLLRAYAYMSRTRVVNRQQPAGQALQSAIRSLTGSSARRHPTGSAADVLAAAAGGMGPADSEWGSSTGTAAEQAETWIVSEYCDLGALAPHVHVTKRFLFPPDNTSTGVATVAGPGAAGGELRRPRLPLILSCLRDIAGGMAHLHSLNVVHGDLKMANVLLSSRPAEEDTTTTATTTTTTTTAAAAEAGLGRAEEAAHGQALPAGGSESSVAPPATSGLLALQLPADMVAKVADFGLSRWLKEGQTHHSTKTVGTVTHMPPELLRSGKLTLSGDVYSFGIIMWELLTGSVPYRGLMYGEVIERVVVSHRRPEFPEHTPPKYRDLAERCWAADAAARPTFAAVLYELEELLREAAVLQADSDGLLAEMATLAAAPLQPPPPPADADAAGDVAADDR